MYFNQKLFLQVILIGFSLFCAVAAKSNSTRSKKPMITSSPTKTETATLAGGCFWCVESDLEPLPGVKEVISGYTGGHKTNPAYKEVSSGTTGHKEAVQVIFDPKQISYSEVLDAFWKKINPLDGEGQFVDRGFQYSTGIFYHTEEQKQLALQSKKELETRGPFNGKKVVTPIRPFTVFYRAEDYHQNYYKENPLRYKFYRYRSGRDQFLAKTWEDFKDFHLRLAQKDKKDALQDHSSASNKQIKPATPAKKPTQEKKQQIKPNTQKANSMNIPEKPFPKEAESQASLQTNPSPKATNSNFKKKQKPSKEELKKRLTPLQYRVTQEEETEKPFANEYWDNKEKGIYVDVVSGEPLFSSLDKYDSGTGWPSFTKPLIPGNIVTKMDFSLLYPRTEVRSKQWDSHLGHVFKDGPPPRGLRYCINSAALRFITKDKLKEEGYEKFTSLFKNPVGK